MNRIVCYDQEETESHFDGFEVMYKEKRVITRNMDGETYVSGYLDYILKKR